MERQGFMFDCSYRKKGMTLHTLSLACYQVLAPCGTTGPKNTTEDTGITL